MRKGRCEVAFGVLSQFFEPDAWILGATKIDNERQVVEFEITGPQLPEVDVNATAPRVTATITERRRSLEFRVVEEGEGE